MNIKNVWVVGMGMMGHGIAQCCEAVWTVYEGVATREDVDQTMRDGFNFPMGPLALGDFVGLELMLNILDDQHRRLGGNKFLPGPLHRSLVAAGHLGRKTGKGFYTCTEEE